MSDAPARAMPKSVTLTLSSSSRITLWGLRSRWITFRRWAKRAASEDLLGDRDRAAQVERRLGPDHVLERPALAVLHRDVVGAVELAAVVDADDVRVLEPGGRGGLAAEALDELASCAKRRCRSFIAIAPPEVRVLGAVHVGHPAGADLVQDAVAPVDDRVLGNVASSGPQQRLHHLLGDRRGDRAALPGRLLDRHGDRDARVRRPARRR